MLIEIFVLSVLTVITIIGYLIFVNARHRRNAKKPRNDPASVLIVVGSGGHTREMLALVKALGKHFQPRFYVIAETDTMSLNKVHESQKDSDREYQIFTIPRSREVKQSYFTSIFTTLRAMVYSFPLVFKLHPEIILSNGPGTCIPVCIAGLVMSWLGIRHSVTMYVESICRVKTLSLSGRLMYHLADDFIVQWPELLQKYPKAKYLGRLI